MMKNSWTILVLKFCFFISVFFYQAQSQTVMEKVGNLQNPAIKLFLCGDVMTGRGIDQVLPQSLDPVLYESYVKDARQYVLLAERENGLVNKPVSYDYIWGDALKIWRENSPDLKIINLETSVTSHDDPWPGKGIHYRMHPENIRLLTTAGIDYSNLANNHTLDWGRPGLEETMNTLKKAEVAFSGVGNSGEKAAKPSILKTDKGRVLIFAYGTLSSGIPPTWAATKNRSGVNFLPDFSEEAINTIKDQVNRYKEEGDIAIFSIHWGGNWGYEVPGEHRQFAHQLIDEADIDLIHGHSSHHPMGMEVYREKLIIYGAGDFINDYEGISGHEEYRGELSLMYFPEIDPTNGDLRRLKIVPMEVKKLRLNRVKNKDAQWLQEVLTREGDKLGTSVKKDKENVLWLEW